MVRVEPGRKEKTPLPLRCDGQGEFEGRKVENTEAGKAQTATSFPKMIQ